MRRERLTGLAVVALLVGGVVAAVTLDDDGRLPGAPSQPRPVAPPEGSLRVGVPELASSYNPFDPRARTPAARQVLSTVLPQLFDVAPDGSVEGRLVDDESVEIDGLEVRFRFREGARWSDGTPVTVDDLAYTLAVVRSERWPGPAAGYDRIETITGQGAEVVIRFRERLPGWRRLFSGDDYVLPSHRLALSESPEAEWAAGPDLAGGPFRFDGWTPGLDVVLSANPEWWGEGPGVEGIQVLTVPDATTLQQLYVRGEVDVAWMPAFTDRRRQTEAFEGEVATAGPGGHLVSMYAQVDRVGADARGAVLDLVDRDRYVGVLLADEAATPGSWGGLGEAGGWPEWSLRTEAAAGLGATRVSLALAREEPMAGLLTRTVQRRARPTRLTIDAVRTLAEQLDGEWLPAGEFDLAIVDEFQWPHPCWSCRWGSEAVGETNWTRFGDGGDLAARADTGDAGAAAELEALLAERSVVLPLWRPGAVVASRGVEGVAANAWQPGPLYRPERWRLASAG